MGPFSSFKQSMSKKEIKKKNKPKEQGKKGKSLCDDKNVKTLKINFVWQVHNLK